MSNQELVIVDFIIQILLEGILRLLQRLAHIRALAGDNALNYCGQLAIQLLRKDGFLRAQRNRALRDGIEEVRLMQWDLRI